VKRITAVCIAVLMSMLVLFPAFAGSPLYTYEVQQLYFTAVDGVKGDQADFSQSSVYMTGQSSVTVVPPPSAHAGYSFDPDSDLNVLSLDFDDPRQVYEFCIVYTKNMSSFVLSGESEEAEELVQEEPVQPVETAAPAEAELNVVFFGEGLTVSAGEAVPLGGYIRAVNGSIGHVAVLFEGYDMIAAEYAPGSDFFDLSACTLDTNTAPLNAPGSYRVILRVTDGAGNVTDHPGCIVTVAPPKADPLDSVQLAAGHIHTAVLRPDGTVISFGSNEDDRIPKKPVTVNQTAVSGWTDIVAIDCGEYHTVGLRADGTVAAAGLNKEGQCELAGWNNIIAIAAGEYHTVGVQKGGMSLFAVGWNKNGPCNVSGLVYPGASPIIAAAAGYEHTVVLREDGTAAAVGNNQMGSGQCNVHEWRDLIGIGAGTYHTVGLRADGTVVAAGDNSYGQCDVGAWYDIVEIAAGDYYTVGLRSDGTVVAAGRNDMGQCNVYGWTDIVSIAAGNSHTVGLQADGRGIATGRNDYGQCGAFVIDAE